MDEQTTDFPTPRAVSSRACLSHIALCLHPRRDWGLCRIYLHPWNRMSSSMPFAFPPDLITLALTQGAGLSAQRPGHPGGGVAQKSYVSKYGLTVVGPFCKDYFPDSKLPYCTMLSYIPWQLLWLCPPSEGTPFQVFSCSLGVLFPPRDW